MYVKLYFTYLLTYYFISHSSQLYLFCFVESHLVIQCNHFFIKFMVLYIISFKSTIPSFIRTIVSIQHLCIHACDKKKFYVFHNVILVYDLLYFSSDTYLCIYTTVEGDHDWFLYELTSITSVVILNF